MHMWAKKGHLCLPPLHMIIAEWSCSCVPDPKTYIGPSTWPVFTLPLSAYVHCLSLLKSSTWTSDQESTHRLCTLLLACQHLLISDLWSCLWFCAFLLSCLLLPACKWTLNWTWGILGLPLAVTLLLWYYHSEVPVSNVCTLVLVPLHCPCRPCLNSQRCSEGNCARGHPHHLGLHLQVCDARAHGKNPRKHWENRAAIF